MPVENKIYLMAYIDKLRRLRGWSRKDVNERIHGLNQKGRPRNDIWRGDQNSVSNTVLKKIAGVFDVSVEKLLEHSLHAVEDTGYLNAEFNETGLSQRSPGAMSYSLNDDHLEDQSPRWVHMRVLAEHHPVVEKVQKILESDEKQTIKALVSNVDVFHEKVVEKRELMNVILEQGKKLEQASWHMKNQDRELAAMRQDLDGLLGRDVKKN